MGKGQMEHRRKFTSDTLVCQKVERDAEGGVRREVEGGKKKKRKNKKKKEIKYRENEGTEMQRE